MEHKLKILERSDKQSPNHPYAKVWLAECSCGEIFRINSCDAHIRRCPNDGGKPGLPES